MPVMPGTWQCPSSTTRPDGTDFYNGDIRIVLPNTGVVLTGPIPGNGCTADSPGSSWSNPPDELEVNRSCLYNMKLGDDADTNGTRWLNHTLHEFGHALGLSHEHARSDANDSSCTESGYGGSANTGFMTPYDRKSVMHYQFLSCGIHGNYDHTGLSASDTWPCISSIRRKTAPPNSLGKRFCAQVKTCNFSRPGNGGGQT